MVFVCFVSLWVYITVVCMTPFFAITIPRDDGSMITSRDETVATLHPKNDLLLYALE